MRYFHLSSVDHQPGAILIPGRWGERLDASKFWLPSIGGSINVKTRSKFYDTWRLTSETVLELIRATEFPDRPSRMQCIFVSDDEVASRNGLTASSASHKLYEVELLEPAAKSFRTDFSLLNSNVRFDAAVQFLPRTREIARQYWSGMYAKVPEVLTQSPVRIVGLV